MRPSPLNRKKKNAIYRGGWGVLCLFFLITFLVLPSRGGERDTGTAFMLTLNGLQAVGGFPPPPVGASYYPLLWGLWGPGWGTLMPFYPALYFTVPPSYPLQSYQPSPPSSFPYPPQIKPAGRLLIFTNPIDAEVYVDGIRLQRQPNLSYKVSLLSGPHQVDIRKEGFKPFSYKVEIPPGGGIVLPVELETQ